MAKMTNTEFKLKKFTDKNNFSILKLNVRDFLVQQGLHKALDRENKKPASITDLDWEDMDSQALNTIRLCLADEVLFNIVEESIAADGEPSCYQEEVDDTYSKKWKTTMEEEMDSLAKNNTWDLIELPHGRSVIGCKWVFKLKWKIDGSIKRYKARLVAKVYSQVEGIEFYEIFLPIVKLVSIRTVLALASLLNLKLEELDVKKTFVHGDLDEEIYME
eukprot:PITA_32682